MKHWGRTQVRANPAFALILTMAILTVVQTMTTDLWYTKFSIAMTVLVFAFKSWVNFVFAITTHRQAGETELSKSMEKYFWALLGQAVVFSLLFAIGLADIMGWPLPILEWVQVRSFVRNLGITSIIAVIIFGEHALEDLLTYIRYSKAQEPADEKEMRQARQQRVLDLTSLTLSRRGERLAREEERRAEQGD